MYRFSSYVDLTLNFNLFTSNWSDGTPSGVIELVVQLVLVGVVVYLHLRLFLVVRLQTQAL